MNDDPAEIWQTTLTDLKDQMSGNFNVWLSDAKLLSVAGSEWQIAVRDEMVREFVAAHLAPSISRALAHHTDQPFSLRFVVRNPDQPSQPLLLHLEDGPPPRPTYPLPDVQYPGIGEDTWGSYSQLPNDLLDLALPYVRPTTCMLILVTFRNTLGTIVNKRGDRQQEWPTSVEDARRRTVMGRASIYTALWEARAMGFLIQRHIYDPTERRQLSQKTKITVEFTLRPRLADEAIDYPTEPKPKR